MDDLKQKLQTWKVADLSVLAIYESARQLGLFDQLGWTDEQHMHALELLMAVWLIANAYLAKRKATAAASE